MSVKEISYLSFSQQLFDSQLRPDFFESIRIVLQESSLFFISFSIFLMHPLLIDFCIAFFFCLFKKWGLGGYSNLVTRLFIYLLGDWFSQVKTPVKLIEYSLQLIFIQHQKKIEQFLRYCLPKKYDRNQQKYVEKETQNIPNKRNQSNQIQSGQSYYSGNIYCLSTQPIKQPRALSSGQENIHLAYNRSWHQKHQIRNEQTQGQTDQIPHFNQHLCLQNGSKKGNILAYAQEYKLSITSLLMYGFPAEANYLASTTYPKKHIQEIYQKVQSIVNKLFAAKRRNAETSQKIVSGSPENPLQVCPIRKYKVKHDISLMNKQVTLFEGRNINSIIQIDNQCQQFNRKNQETKCVEPHQNLFISNRTCRNESEYFYSNQTYQKHLKIYRQNQTEEKTLPNKCKKLRTKEMSCLKEQLKKHDKLYEVYLLIMMSDRVLRQHVSSNSVLLLEEEQTVSYYLPSYVRFFIHQISHVDKEEHTASISGALIFSFYYGNIQDALLSQFVCSPDRAILLEFNQTQSMSLIQGQKIIMREDKKQKIIYFVVKQTFKTTVKGDLFLTPFVILNLYLQVVIHSVSIKQNNRNILIKFNCMDSDKVEIVTHGQDVIFGMYRLAPYYFQAKYTNSRKNPFPRQGCDKHDWEDKCNLEIIDIDESRIKSYQYSHFNVSIYQFPTATIRTVFLPIWILSVICLLTFFQENSFSGRNAAVLTVAFISFLSTVNIRVPPSANIKLIDILVIMNISSVIFLMASSFDFYSSKDQNIQPFNWRGSNLFIASIALNCCTFTVILLLYLIHKCYWEPKYKGSKTLDRKNHTKIERSLWQNKELDSELQSSGQIRVHS